MAGFFRRALRFGRRVLVGPDAVDKPGSILRRMADSLPNLITKNAKALNGGGAATLVLLLQEQFGVDVSGFEHWIVVIFAVIAAVWRTPNRETPAG